MEMTTELHDVVNKIDELKEKLTDNEYKDLLELTQKYYDKCKEQEEKAKKKFVRCLIIKSSLTYYEKDKEHDREDLYVNNITYRYEAPCEKDDCECGMCGEVGTLERVYCEVTQSVETQLFEIKNHSDFSGWCINETESCMSEYALGKLKDKKYMTHYSDEERACFVFLEEFEC